jgi:xylulokinase
MARAVIEGVSFAIKDSLVLMARLGVSPDELFAVGGGARSPIWRNWLAAILGVGLQRLEVEEGPAMGAALLGAVGAGIHSDVDAAVSATVRRQGAAETADPELEARYQPIYDRFIRLYPALKATNIWHQP